MMCPSEGFFIKVVIIMDVKQPELLCKQVEKLKEHGCEIENFEQALLVLSKINYYKLTAYFLPYRLKDGTYATGTSLIKVYKIYEFERKLLSFLYGVIQEIEVFIKTQIAYYHANKYGSLGYMDSSNVKPSATDKHKKLIEHFTDEIERNSDLPFVKHHIENYESNFPFWVAIEIFTLGNTSQFYSQMKTSDKKIISSVISDITDIRCTYKQLESCLHCLTILRNKCAHFSRIYYSKFTATPNLPKTEEKKAYIKGRKYIYLFPYIFVLKILYPSAKNWNIIVNTLANMIEEYSEFIDIKHIGFPNNWEELLS